MSKPTDPNHGNKQVPMYLPMLFSCLCGAEATCTLYIDGVASRLVCLPCGERAMAQHKENHS